MTDPAPLTDEELAALKSWLRHRPSCDSQPWKNNPPRPCTCGTAALFDRLISDLRAARAEVERLLTQDGDNEKLARFVAEWHQRAIAAEAEVERHKLRAEQAEAAMARLDRLLSENVQAGRERAAEVERLRSAVGAVESMHSPMRGRLDLRSDEESTVCDFCFDAGILAWPCPTLEALRAGDASHHFVPPNST